MINIPDRDADLRLYYDQVIDTHKKLATVLSDVASKVVDGRISNHDLPKMLEDLAEREGIMADNWTLVRNGLFSKVIDTVVLEVTDVSTAVHASDSKNNTGSQNSMSKKRKFNHSEQQEDGASTELSRDVNGKSVQENSQRKAQPKPEVPILTKIQRRETHENLEQAMQVAKISGNQQEITKVLQLRKEFNARVQQQKKLGRLEDFKMRQIAQAKKEAKEARKLAREQEEREKEEYRSRAIAGCLAKAQWKADNAELVEKKAAERLVKQQKKQDAKARHFALEVERSAAEASIGLQERQAEPETTTQHEKKSQADRERMTRYVARNKISDAAEVSDQPAFSLPPAQRPLPSLIYEAENLIIKEEVIEAWEI